VREALLHAIWKPFITAMTESPFQSFWITDQCREAYCSFRSIKGDSASEPKIMCDAVITNGNRRPYSPSAQRLSKLRKQFRNKYLLRAPPGQTQPARAGAEEGLPARRHESAVQCGPPWRLTG
jgi:hypothetical protein